MPQEGKLTPAQFEILQKVWDSPDGLEVSKIWDAVKVGRNVSRTTVLNLVDRLEKRGWLTRSKDETVFRYRATVDRATAEGQLTNDFVQEFFGGSAMNMLMSLLGSKPVKKTDIRKLQQLLDAADAE
jgi:BlaI family penicillinase repressor